MTSPMDAEAVALELWDKVVHGGKLYAVEAITAALREERARAIEECAKVADDWTKRSNYGWSEGGEYTMHDYVNEGAIKCAGSIVTVIRALKDGT